MKGSKTGLVVFMAMVVVILYADGIAAQETRKSCLRKCLLSCTQTGGANFCDEFCDESCKGKPPSGDKSALTPQPHGDAESTETIEA